MSTNTQQRDAAIYDQVLREHRGEELIGPAFRESKPLAPPPDRMRELAKLPRRPPMTPHIAECLAKLAEEVRPRAKSRSGLYGLRKSVAAEIRRAINWIDDNAEFHRRHR